MIQLILWNNHRIKKANNFLNKTIYRYKKKNNNNNNSNSNNINNKIKPIFNHSINKINNKNNKIKIINIKFKTNKVF